MRPANSPCQNRRLRWKLQLNSCRNYLLSHREGEVARKIAFDTGAVDDIVAAGGDVWLATDKGELRVSRAGDRAERIDGVTG
jgi:hypothetical protein